MPKEKPTSPPVTRVEISESQWQDPLWRLSNLYYILDEEGRKIEFRPNEEQIDFYQNQWYLNVILKARQLGFTTFIDLMALDACIFNENYAAGIIAHHKDDAKKIFRKKIKYGYDHLPDGLKAAVPIVKDTDSELVFRHGSEISVGTSMRSGTLQFLHVSEFGKICCKYPDKAEEIVTGAFNAVHAGQRIYVESTAEGRSGQFYEICKKSQDKKKSGTKLNVLDFKFHFYPWWKKISYTIDGEGISITQEQREYFRKLQEEQGITLTEGQRAWYAAKEAAMGDKMLREFPSYPEEAFHQALVGSYYGSTLSKMRQQSRIRKVPFTSGFPVNTFWDLGRNDCTAIWMHQFVAGEHRFIRYFEDSGCGLEHYVRYLNEWALSEGCLFGTYYLPHDAMNKNLEHNQSRVDRLVELGVPYSKIEVVPRISNIDDGIEMVRAILPACWIDEENCAKGLICLEEYQKQWDERNGVFRNAPLHNHASNGADAFRQFAQGYRPQQAVSREGIKRSRPRSHKVL